MLLGERKKEKNKTRIKRKETIPPIGVRENDYVCGTTPVFLPVILHLIWIFLIWVENSEINKADS